MCGRYYVYETDTVNSGSVARDVFPSSMAAVLTAQGVASMRWGFASPAGKGLIINARSETAASKPMFRAAAESGHCLVPAAGYYEWRRLSSTSKSKYEITLPLDSTDSAQLYMAGLYRREHDEYVFCILTKEPAPNIAFIHNRMPLILATPALRTSWLVGDLSLAEAVSAAPKQMHCATANEQISFL